MSDEIVNYKGKEGRGIKKCKPLETGDLSASLDLIMSSIEINGAKVRSYPNTAEGLEMFTQNSKDFFRYLAELNSNPEIEKKLIPDIEAWALYIGVSRITIFNYQKRGGVWADTIEYFKNAIATARKQLSCHFKIPPVLQIFDLKCNFGYVEQQGEALSRTATDSTPDEQAAANGLYWNEKTERFEPMEG